MISLGSTSHLGAPHVPCTSFKVVGIGGAGLALVDRLALDGEDQLDLTVMHTNAQALMASVAPRKVQLGREAAVGLGAGGDPDLGRAAAEESVADIRAEMEGAQVVVLCAGLGAGTGSGAAPVIAREAREAGALVLALVTLPFACEGAKRREQAHAALALLGREAAAVLCFENDRMMELTGTEAPLAESFQAASATLSRSLRAMARMVSLPSLMHVGLDELLKLFQGGDPRCLFGYGEASGANRCHEAAEAALQSPLLDQGRMLSEAGDVLVHVTGDPGLRMVEVQAVLHEIGRHIEDSSQIHLGISIDPAASDGLGVTIVGSLRGGEDIGDGEIEAQAGDEVPVAPRRSAPAEDDPEERDVPEAAPPAPVNGRAPGRGKPAKGARGAAQASQVELPLGGETLLRGRFKGLEPNIVDGQDLDIPAFIRMKIRLK